MKKLRITVEGRAYEVQVEVLEDDGTSTSLVSTPPAPAVAASAPAVPKAPAAPAVAQPKAKAAPAAGESDVPCQVSGMVVSVDVAVGSEVTEGQQLVTIEAMKMNTYVMAPRAGRVTEVLVSKGKSVLAGDVLVRLA